MKVHFLLFILLLQSITSKKHKSMRISPQARRRFKGIDKAFTNAFGEISDNLNLEKIHKKVKEQKLIQRKLNKTKKHNKKLKGKKLHKKNQFQKGKERNLAQQDQQVFKVQGDEDMNLIQEAIAQIHNGQQKKEKHQNQQDEFENKIIEGKNYQSIEKTHRAGSKSNYKLKDDHGIDQIQKSIFSVTVDSDKLNKINRQSSIEKSDSIMSMQKIQHFDQDPSNNFKEVIYDKQNFKNIDSFQLDQKAAQMHQLLSKQIEEKFNGDGVIELGGDLDLSQIKIQPVQNNIQDLQPINDDNYFQHNVNVIHRMPGEVPQDPTIFHQNNTKFVISPYYTYPDLELQGKENQRMKKMHEILEGDEPQQKQIKEPQLQEFQLESQFEPVIENQKQIPQEDPLHKVVEHKVEQNDLNNQSQINIDVQPSELEQKNDQVLQDDTNNLNTIPQNVVETLTQNDPLKNDELNQQELDLLENDLNDVQNKANEIFNNKKVERELYQVQNKDTLNQHMPDMYKNKEKIPQIQHQYYQPQRRQSYVRRPSNDHQQQQQRIVRRVPQTQRRLIVHQNRQQNMIRRPQQQLRRVIVHQPQQNLKVQTEHRVMQSQQVQHQPQQQRKLDLHNNPNYKRVRKYKILYDKNHRIIKKQPLGIFYVPKRKLVQSQVRTITQHTDQNQQRILRQDNNQTDNQSSDNPYDEIQQRYKKMVDQTVEDNQFIQQAKQFLVDDIKKIQIIQYYIVLNNIQCKYFQLQIYVIKIVKILNAIFFLKYQRYVLKLNTYCQ